MATPICLISCRRTAFEDRCRNCSVFSIIWHNPYCSMSHLSNVPVALKASMIRAVEGLEDRLPDYVDLEDESTIPQAWGCAYSCDYVKIFGCAFLVDFTAGTILDDPSSKPCDRAPAAAAGAAAAGDASPARKMIKHPRVDVLQNLDKFKKETLQRPPQISIYDESLIQAIGADKAIHLQSPEKVPPSSFLIALRTLAIQVGEIIAANSAAIASMMVKNQTKTVRSVTAPRSIIVSTAPSDTTTMDIPNKNNLTLSSVQRGLLEFADHAALTHRTFYSAVGFHDFMAALFENMRPDIAEVTSVIQDPDAVSRDLSTKVDQNTFFVAGVRALTGNRPALEEFFRKERARFTAVAKAAGWKPKEALSPQQPIGTRPSPDATGRQKPTTPLGKRPTDSRNTTAKPTDTSSTPTPASQDNGGRPDGGPPKKWRRKKGGRGTGKQQG
jgi:hypothetical protein